MRAQAKGALFEYCLRLGDNSLVLGQRLSEWCGHAPDFEMDMAASNLALDLIGQARLILDYAGKYDGSGRDADTLAFTRDVLQFRNILLVEQPNADWARTIARQFLFSTFQAFQFAELARSKDQDLAAIAAKSSKEIAYHKRFASGWMVRLGDGTEESHERLQRAVDRLWRFMPEMFDMDEVDRLMLEEGVGVDAAKLAAPWQGEVESVLREATLQMPKLARGTRGGRLGHHSEHLGHLLTEMQFLQRAYPGAEW